MADAVANSFLVVVLPLYLASGRVAGDLFGLSAAAATGVILAGFGFFNAGLQPFAGRISDRLGKRKVFVLGGLLGLAALNFLYSLTGSYLAVLLVRLGQGATVAFTVTASVALVNELSTRENRGTNMGAYNSLRLLGFGAGPLAAGFVVSSGPYDLLGHRMSGYDAAFYIATLGALVSAGLVTLLVKEPESTAPKEDEGFRIAVLSRTKEHVLDPIFALGLGTLVMALCISLLSAIEPNVNRRLDQGPRWFGVEFAVFVLSLSLLQPVVGRLSDRWGRHRFIVVGLALLAPTTLVQGLVLSPGGMIAARITQGVAGSLAFAPTLALGGDLARKGASGAQLSVLTMAFGLGISFGQLSAGFLIRWGYVVPFATGAGLAVLAALLVWRQVDEPPREEERSSDAQERRKAA